MQSKVFFVCLFVVFFCVFFSYFSVKTYVVGTVEALLMSSTTYVFLEK